MKFLLVLLISLIYFISPSVGITCLGERGEFVDWFYIYKLPKNSALKASEEERARPVKRKRTSSVLNEQPANSNIEKGYQYLYLSSNQLNQGWKLSNNSIASNNSSVGRTLSIAFESKRTLLVLYNDDPPNAPSKSTGGHTKGAIAVDNDSGFWLIHSVPNFPDNKTLSYSYPSTGVIYGQSFLCVSLPKSQIDIVGKQQVYNEPNIYYSRIPPTLRHNFPNLQKAIAKKKIKTAPFFNEEIITSLNGTQFRSFAKTRRFHKELYVDLVAPHLNADLLVETWRHGTGVLPSNCTKKPEVLNVSQLNVTVDTNRYLFNSTDDHSKWAVGFHQSTDWICVGDINRAAPQAQRGGGTVCQISNLVADSYRRLISLSEPCPRKNVTFWKKIFSFF